MGQRQLDAQGEQALEQTLGYLNFSAGAPDPQFLGRLNRLFEAALLESSQLEAGSSQPEAGANRRPTWRIVCGWLEEKLGELRGVSPAFSDTEQVDGVLKLLQHHVVPGYLDYHRDLLFHQAESDLLNAFYVGRFCEAILKQGGPWDEVDRIVRGAIKQLNDFIGHRPVPSLESRKTAAYPHEFIRPVPLFVRGAGVAAGPTREVVEIALKLLEQTDAPVLRAAQFDPQALEELAYDPRAYDFDHPANKRPNYHFGQWDPHRIDNQGRYRRFVVQQVTLDALMRRVTDGGPLPREQLIVEAAAVLAGTILMASGVSGYGPEAHSSDVTLSNLLPTVARYRDEFYERLIRKISGPHAERLKAESAERQQPFGGARQHLNAELARRRASQLEHVHLAKTFARMGFPEAALRQAAIVPTASARMLCQMDCWLTEGNRAIRAGEPERAMKLAGRILDLLRRAIECGAVIDPWNILGFDSHFSLFPAAENSVHDHRADELCALIEQLFDLYSRTWSEAAARNNQALSTQVARQFREVTEWWHRFATHQVSSVEAVNALDAYQGASHVVEALALWHQGGASTGAVAFWQPYAAMFNSPQAYALVLKTLLEKRDFVAAMGLLIHWLNHAEPIGLVSGESAFHDLAEQWLAELLRENPGEPIDSAERLKRWNLARKFFDYLEANAEEYWRVPGFELADASKSRKKPASPSKSDDESREDDDRDELDGIDDESGEADGDEQDTFLAAYENKIFIDSTDDGVEGQIFETADSTHDELTREARRIALRLDFLACLSRLWKQAALYTVQLADAVAPAPPSSPNSGASAASSASSDASASSDETQNAAGSQGPAGLQSSAGSQGARDRDASGSESSRDDASRSAAVERSAILQHWSAQATANYQSLLDLLESIRDYRIPAPASRHDAMLEYDQRRYAKESLMEQVVETAIETVDARRLLLASSLAQLPGAAGSRLLDSGRGAELLTPLRELESDQRQATMALASLLRNDVAELNRRWPDLIAALRSVALLYVPLAKGGEPRTIVAARLRQRTLQDLLTCLPRRGCYVQTCQLIDAARDMERMFPVGPGAVTEFDELFKVGFKAMVGCLIDTARHWPSEPSGSAPTGGGPFSGASFEGIDPPPHELVECLEKLTEAQLLVWLAHSKTLRLSVLEKVQDKRAWKKTLKFIEQYGHDLFTQHFLNVGNIRSILHRGVETWLTQLMEDPDQEFSPRLLDELGRAIPQSEAVEQLTLILEAIHENYGEYRDYNSTTTQSDRGEMLYTLLDFLRLRTRYDRIAWNLKPVVWVHEVLVRRGQENAAAVWRRALSERIHEESDQFMSSLAELQKRYAMRMPTVADRLAERFIRPLAIDRIRAFVAPAVREAEAGGPHPVFDLLEKETDLLTLQPSGVGLDPPPWLLALEEEVMRVRDPLGRHDVRSALQAAISVTPLTIEQVRVQLEQIVPSK